mgnify:CR=1 FL=1|nr:MAG TPA_asm: hypothetical protein [Caudoviricetes sp.]
MSEKIFKPVADVFALIHAGGAPYQWTTSADAAVEWLKENPKYSVKEYVTLERYQDAVSDDTVALKQRLEQAEGDAQVGLQLSERLARQLGEAQEALESEKRLSAMYKKMRGTAVAGHAQDLERINAVAEELGKLAGAMLNRTLDSGSKQAVAYADCADMVAKFAAQLRAGEAK